MVSNQTISELLLTLSNAEKLYAKAKSDLVDIQRKLHGIPYILSETSLNDDVLTNVSNVKRGRGRPKKNKSIVEVITSNPTTNVSNPVFEPDSQVTRDDDPLSSLETVDFERDNVFKDARYTYINENIYIETKCGNYHDVKTRELRGWYNPYSSCHEWL
jgi:hypothetical protein